MNSSFVKNILKAGKSFLLISLIISHLFSAFIYNATSKNNDESLQKNETHLVCSSGILCADINFINKISQLNEIINSVKSTTDKGYQLFSIVQYDITVLSYFSIQKTFDYNSTHSLEKTSPRSPPSFC
jgi:hypothetical protein